MGQLHTFCLQTHMKQTTPLSFWHQFILPFRSRSALFLTQSTQPTIGQALKFWFGANLLLAFAFTAITAGTLGFQIYKFSVEEWPKWPSFHLELKDGILSTDLPNAH